MYLQPSILFAMSTWEWNLWRGMQMQPRKTRPIQSNLNLTWEGKLPSLAFSCNKYPVHLLPICHRILSLYTLYLAYSALLYYYFLLSTHFTTTTTTSHNKTTNTIKMSKSRAPIIIGGAAVTGIGYYLYAAGGNPRAAEKKAESTRNHSLSQWFLY